MRRTQIFLSDEMHDQLKFEAKQTGITTSEFIRELLAEALTKGKRNQAEQGVQTLLEMLEDPVDDTEL